MSRGLGSVQRAIVAHVLACRVPTTVETVRWALWDKSLKLSKRGLCDLPKAWNSSIDRAVRSLTGNAGGPVQLIRRRLASIDEVIEHYPNKTFGAKMRALRAALLPALVNWVNDGRGTRYSVNDNEAFHRQRLSSKTMLKVQRRWIQLQPALIRCLPALTEEQQQPLFLLIAKGKSLFEKEEMGIRVSVAFRECGDSCAKAKCLPNALQDQINDLVRILLPAEESGPLRVKSYIHSFADVPRHRRPRLKQDALEFLEEARGDIVRRLEGYEKPEPPQDGWPRANREQSSRHSDLLTGMIDQSVFSRFRFIQPREEAGRGFAIAT